MKASKLLKKILERYFVFTICANKKNINDFGITIYFMFENFVLGGVFIIFLMIVSLIPTTSVEQRIAILLFIFFLFLILLRLLKKSIPDSRKNELLLIAKRLNHNALSRISKKGKFVIFIVDFLIIITIFILYQIMKYYGKIS